MLLDSPAEDLVVCGYHGCTYDAIAGDAARKDDPFLDFWFSEEARRRIDGLVARLTKRA